MVKEPGYTYSSPTTMWINVINKYNRGSVIQYSTGCLFYYERVGHHLETSAQYPNDHEKKKRYREKDNKFT